jgi:tight adherence protein C
LASLLFILFGALFCTLFMGAALSHLFKRQITIRERVVEYFGNDINGGRLGKKQDRKTFDWGILKSIQRRLKVWIEHHMKPAKKKALEERLREAGYPMNLSADFQLLQFLAGAIVFLCLVPLMLGLGANLLSILLLATIMSALAMYCMSFYVSILIKRRRLAIQKMMPDFFDMVNLSIEAGMGLDASIMKISRQMKGPLSDEFLQTLRDMELGKSRREAFADLPRPCPLIPKRHHISHPSRYSRRQHGQGSPLIDTANS